MNQHIQLQNFYGRILDSLDGGARKSFVRRWSLSPSKKDREEFINELFVGAVLEKEGQVFYEKDISGYTPDWLVQRMDKSFVVEAISITQSVELANLRKQDQFLVERLQTIPHPLLLKVQRLNHTPVFHDHVKSIIMDIKSAIQSKEIFETPYVRYGREVSVLGISHGSKHAAVVEEPNYFVEDEPTSSSLRNRLMKKTARYSHGLAREEIPFVISVSCTRYRRISQYNFDSFMLGHLGEDGWLTKRPHVSGVMLVDKNEDKGVCEYSFLRNPVAINPVPPLSFELVRKESRTTRIRGF